MAKILVVDDDKSLAELIETYLEEGLHEVDLVHKGEDAFAHLKTRNYDLVILDWMLLRFH